MKLIKRILLAVAIAATCFNAKAQFNAFEENRIINIPCVLKSAATSNVFDMAGFQGVVLVHLAGFTNSGAGTITGQLYSSPDWTNWTAVPYATPTASTVITTNSYYAASLTGTNTYLLPGALTTPTAFTAGFETSYIAAPVYTNVGAVSIIGGTVFAYNVNSTSGRYLSVVATPSASSTITGAIVGKKQQTAQP